MKENEKQNQRDFGVAYRALNLKKQKDINTFEQIQENIRAITKAAINTLMYFYKNDNSPRSKDEIISNGEEIANIIAKYGFHDVIECFDSLTIFLQKVASKKNVRFFDNRFGLHLTINEFIQELALVCKEKEIDINKVLSYQTLPKSIKVEPVFFYTEEEEQKIQRMIDDSDEIAKQELEAKKKENEKLQAGRERKEEEQLARLEAEKAEEKRLQTEKNARAEEKRKQEIAKIIDRVFRLRADMKDLDAFSVEVYSQLNKDLLDRKIKFNSNDAKIEKYKKELKVAEKNLEEAMNEVCKQPRSIMTRLPNGKCARIEIYPAIG